MPTNLKVKFQKDTAAAAAAKSLQSCPTLCDSIDCSCQAPPSLGFSRQEQWMGCHFLLQCMKVKVELLSRVPLFATPWTAAYQAPPAMEFSKTPIAIKPCSLNFTKKFGASEDASFHPQAEFCLFLSNDENLHRH